MGKKKKSNISQEEKVALVRKLRPIDDILFEVLAQDKDVVEEIIRVLLTDPKLTVVSVVPQKSVPNLLGRAVRLDALCYLGDGRMCNVEVQRADNDDHLRRVRYNFSGITWTSVKKKEKFKNIPGLCVIYISEFDFLGGGRTIYHIDKTIRETGEVINDGLEEIFVNTSIDDGSLIADLMRCFLQANVADERFPALSEKMDFVKNTEKGVLGMCAVIDKYFGDELADALRQGRAEGEKKGREVGKAEGIAEGKIEGESKLAALIAAMSAGSDAENIAKAASDPAFREEMYKKYGIE